jgi:uncharacterized protein (DUF1501 family)
MFTRRDFLKSSSLVTLSLGAGALLPRFLNRTAAAAPLAGKPGSKDTILVVVQLTGGNDGLNTVIPFKDPLYAKYRPTLKQPVEQIKKLNDEVGLHPALGGFASLWEDKALCVVQGVGYPNPSQSHFRSMDVWQAGSTAETLRDGWLGKALGRMSNAPAYHMGAPNEAAPFAFTGSPIKIPSLTSLEEFQLRTAAASNPDNKAQRSVIEGAAKSPSTPTSGGGSGGGLIDFVQRTANNTYASSRRIAEINKNYEPKSPYPATGLANRLKLAAQLIDAELGARIYYVSIDGFDTHAGQEPTHTQLLNEVSEAMTAFFKDLDARGQRERVLLMTFSEFGRRAKENGSKGTDHGSGAPVFLIGGKVHAGVVGAHPSLEKLEDGNLKHHTDFRQVYASILDSWLGVPSREVLGAKYEAIPILRS